MSLEKNNKNEFIRLMSDKYPTLQAAATEYINLEAILRLPKGTEHFLSDLHGEYGAFKHIMNNCSGVIREKIEILFGNSMTKNEREEFATLIYYPKEIILEKKAQGKADIDWYLVQLHRLVKVCRFVSSKYTRSKVRKSLPKYFDYIIDELINMDRDDFDKEAYYNEIFASIIDLKRADAFIIAMTELIKRLAVDKLHIVGDIFDRGKNPDKIVDLLISHHNVDIQWGNHDIQWIGAHMGNLANIFSVIDISLKYGNLDLIEEGYGISLRKLALYAEKIQLDTKYLPVGYDKNKLTYNDIIIAKMRKAAFLMQLKSESEIISRHPEYNMEDRDILNHIDYSKNEYLGVSLNSVPFENINIDNPSMFTKEEKEVAITLKRAFRKSEKLHRHILFIVKNGSAYKIFNNNLIFHGCIPLKEDGSYMEFCGYKGKDLMDYCDNMVRKTYLLFLEDKEINEDLDFFYYLWCGKCSPLYGREKITTFERLYIDDKKFHDEKENPYYKYRNNRECCENILKSFGLSGQYSHIINGHVPVITKLGENPVKAEGKMVVIDGGFCKAYHEKTGIAGYTLIYNSRGLRLCAHEPFNTVEDAIKNRKDIHSEVTVFETQKDRILVKNTDTGKNIKIQLESLKLLMNEYQNNNM